MRGRRRSPATRGCELERVAVDHQSIPFVGTHGRFRIGYKDGEGEDAGLLTMNSGAPMTENGTHRRTGGKAIPKTSKA